MLLNFIKFVFMMRIKIKFIHKRASSLHSHGGTKMVWHVSSFFVLLAFFGCEYACVLVHFSPVKKIATHNAKMDTAHIFFSLISFGIK